MACLHGDFAVAIIDGFTIASLFDWEVDYDTNYVDGSAYADFWEYPRAARSRWRFRCKAYVTPSQAAILLSVGWNSASDPTAVVLTGFSGDASTAVVFQGTGKPERGSFSAPGGAAAVQEVEFVGFGSPGGGVGHAPAAPPAPPVFLPPAST